MKKFLRLVLILALIFVVLVLFNPSLRRKALDQSNLFLSKTSNGHLSLTPAQIKHYSNVQTKVVKNINFPIYKAIINNGPINRFTSTKYFWHGLIQSQASAHTEKGTFWQIAVDGRNVGWVSDHFFVKNKIAVAPRVSLVRNTGYSFNPRDAISYVTNSQGTLVNPKKVHLSQRTVNSATSGQYQIAYRYDQSKAHTFVTVRSNLGEGITMANKIPKIGPHEVHAFTGSSRKSSPNWNLSHNYQPETRISNYSVKPSGSLKTRLYQPRFHLLDYSQENSNLNQIGVVPEGISLKHFWLTASMFTDGNQDHGRLVSYNLRKLKNPLAAQNLLTMPWPSFVKYSKNIRVSPYLKLGHGQSIGTSKKYLYVLANNDHWRNSPQSEEIMQISKNTMTIHRIWTFKIWNHSSYFPRYIHNAYFVNSHTIYALFHNGLKNSYEYWKITRHGNTFIPTEIASTQGNFVNNLSPVQGFAYNNGKFYLTFNDNIFVVKKDGTFEKHYAFHSLRESEGIAVNHDKIYLELAHRPELLSMTK